MKHIRWSRLCLSANLLAVPFATLLGLAPNAQARLAVLRIVSPHQGPTIRGFTHTTVKVAGEAQKVDVYIDRHYLRSGPSYIISWSSTEVSNGPHRITDTDLRGAATNSILTATSSAVLVLADQREEGTCGNTEPHRYPPPRLHLRPLRRRHRTLPLLQRLLRRQRLRPLRRRPLYKKQRRRRRLAQVQHRLRLTIHRIQ